MGEQNDQVPSTIVNVKRVRKGEGKGKAQDQEQLVLTFGLYEDFKTKESKNGLDELIQTLLPYQGKQVNIDIRVTQKQGARGQSFDTAFVIVKEMIPLGATAGGTTTKFVPKTNTQSTIKAQAQKFARGVE